MRMLMGSTIVVGRAMGWGAALLDAVDAALDDGRGRTGAGPGGMVPAPGNDDDDDDRDAIRAHGAAPGASPP